MNNKVLIIIIALLLSFGYSSAQSSFPKQLAGYWISYEYEKVLADSQSEKIGALISPQFLYFDSLGRCTIQTRIEHKLAIGKPVRSRNFGDALQFTYIINKSKINVNQVKDDNNLLYVTFSDVPVSIVFKRYEQN
ncbi:MAG: hypothetical protein J0H55_16390 [Chitinophagaceae bacterium]|nr:hypothetical protein [Chitinophagaceae bacterium]